MLEGIKLLRTHIQPLFLPADWDDDIAPVPAPLPYEETDLLVDDAVRLFLKDVAAVHLLDPFIV